MISLPNSQGRKGEGEGRAALLQREGKVIASIAACAVGKMMSLLL